MVVASPQWKTEDPGRRLRRIREQLRLRYRDVEEASQQIARNRGNQEFSVGLSRLADIENRGTIPSLYRLYSLCVIYGLKFEMVLTWFGIDLNELALDAARLSLRQTRVIDFTAVDSVLPEAPIEFSRDLDLTKTIYLNPHIRRWGKLPLSVLGGLNLKKYRYAFIGVDDWFMYPLLPPGSFVQIDETERHPAEDAPTQEHERPIYLLEHRQGFRCGWCTETSGHLIVQPHPESNLRAELYRYPGEVDVIGRVIAVAKRLDLAKRRHTRS
ncbi:MAG TPA: helix-turn-helix transcriptional regulator [Bryobacteraceae bacterium]|jgi:transcriptional regulator with XRE-family HTH domain|nr:helix-turn-helix transcriptional regulator [Bryobacteraceae bacterium]